MYICCMVTEQELLLSMKETIDNHTGDSMSLAESLFQMAHNFYVKELKLQEFTEKFREIFPPIKLPTGKNFKSNLKDLEKKLLFFFKHYDYSPETVLEAAKQYVIHAESVRYNYIRTAAYFVHKVGEGSDLADWCEKVITPESNENQEPIQTFL